MLTASRLCSISSHVDAGAASAAATATESAATLDFLTMPDVERDVQLNVTGGWLEGTRRAERRCQ